MQLLNYVDKDNQFYPTPSELVNQLVHDIDWDMIETVLEPSAGKGNIINGIVKYLESLPRYKYHHSLPDIDAIEIDSNLRAILKENYSKYSHIVHDDFLTFESYKKYDLIIMNPPFKYGAEHLLKAIELQEKWGGAIVCILNAETIKNPCTDTRKLLARKLNEYEATITFKENCFTYSERNTDVEIAIIKIHIPYKKQESEIYKRFQKAMEYEDIKEPESTDIEITDIIKQAVNQYKVEVKSSIELINQFRALKPYIQRNLGDDPYNSSILRLTIGDERYKDDISINEYIKAVRLKYWKGLLNNDKLMGKLTSELREKYYDMINDLVNYEFSEFNINQILVNVNAEIKKGIEDTIIKLFDKLTFEHTWYAECKNNRHYYNGWRTNEAYKVGKKSIIPVSGVFSDTYRYGGKTYSGNGLQVMTAYNILSDIEKAFNYLDGNMTAEVDLKSALEMAKYNPKNIKCKYFNVTFYKKGTCHITYTNQKLVDKLNIYACMGKNWLPPHYGKKTYKDMTEEEKQVIDNFQGEESYNEVLNNAGYYLNTNYNGLYMA